MTGCARLAASASRHFTGRGSCGWTRPQRLKKCDRMRYTLAHRSPQTLHARSAGRCPGKRKTPLDLNQFRQALATVIPVPVTPFAPNGQLDMPAYRRLIGRLIDGG